MLSNALLDFAVCNEVEIVQKYFEREHTQMEVDSIHSSLQTRLKNRSIYYPTQYVELFKECRPSQPYEVFELTYQFFLDFTGVKYVDSIRPGRSAGDPVVHDLRALRYTHNPPCISFKTNFTEEAYKDLPQRLKIPRERWEMNGMFQARLAIKKSKYDHLQQLKQVMPEIYHEYYDNLPFA